MNKRCVTAQPFRQPSKVECEAPSRPHGVNRMKNTIRISVGIVALISGAALANAMEGPSPQTGATYRSPALEQVQAMENRSSQQGAEERAPAAGERGGQALEEQAERNAAAARQRAEERNVQPGMKQRAEQQGSTGENRTSPGQASEQERTGQSGAAERQSATGPRSKAELRGAAEQGNAAQFDQQQQRRDAQQQGAQGRAPLAQGQESLRPGATPQARPGAQAVRPQQLQGQARAQGTAISPDQQARIRDTVRNDNIARLNRRNVRRNVGAAVPRSESLEVLPREVVAIVPQYRGYRFAIVEDDIVIVDPRTYRVAAVIPRRAGQASSRAVRSPDLRPRRGPPRRTTPGRAPIGPGGRTCRC